jgi:hypothetical protein
VYSLEIEDDFIKRLKEEEALLRVKAEALGISIELPPEKAEEERQEKEEKHMPTEQPTDEPKVEHEVEEEKEESKMELAQEEKDRFTLFLEDVKKQRTQLEGGEEVKEEIDLLAETDDMLDLYTKDYIASNLEEARRQHDILSGTPIPQGTDMLTEKKIRNNLADFATRIKEAEEFMEAVPRKKTPPRLAKEPQNEYESKETRSKDDSRRNLYRDFLAKTEKFIEEFPHECMSDAIAECEEAFGKLLQEGKSLPTEEEPDLEKKILTNLEHIQNEIVGVKKSRHEERGRLILKAVRKLKDSGTYNPTAYNNIAMKFQNLSPDLSDELKETIKEELAECYSKMKEIEAKRKEEEKKAQAEGIRVYWGTYLKKIDTFVSEIEKARPVEIMDYYVRYKKLIAEYERMNKQEISEFEIEAAQGKLDECYELLERLRLQA